MASQSIVGGELYYQRVIRDAPLGYWRMDAASGTSETDRSGNGHNGTIGSNILLNQTGAIADGDKAEGFQATGSVLTSLVQVGAAVPLSASGASVWTVEAWAKFTGGPSSGDGYFILAKPKSAFSAYSLCFNSGVAGKVVFRLGNAPNSINQAISNSTVNDGNWHYIVGVKRASGNMEIWIDGALDKTATPAAFNIEDNNNAAGFLIGNGWTTDNTLAFVGSIDEVAIYNYGLTSDQIKAHYGLRLAAVAGGLLVGGSAGKSTHHGQTIVGSGGLRAGGAAAYLRHVAARGLGGMDVGGSASPTRHVMYQPSGGLDVSGAATVRIGRHFPSDILSMGIVNVTPSRSISATEGGTIVQESIL